MTDLIKDALEDMVWQFAPRGLIEGKRCLSTGGLSALENAFAALGWEDPKFTTEGQCSISECLDWADSVGAYPRSRAREGLDSSMVGFGYLCWHHMQEWNLRAAGVCLDLGRLKAAP